MTHTRKELASLVGPRGVVPADRVAEWIGRGEDDVETLMVRLLPTAAIFARAPVSKFPVGAVALAGEGEDPGPLSRVGNLYLGANLEFVGGALGMTVHAEQSAINNAWLHGETRVRALAVTAPPCGHCRQFLLELAGAESLDILVAANDSSSNRPYAKDSLAVLLPVAFGPEHLAVTKRLLTPDRRPLLPRPPERLVQEALEAAERSYSPYTSNYAGVALQSAHAEVFVGRIAENAAFNPTLSPLAGALSQLALTRNGTAWDIAAAVLVEVPTRMSQRASSEALLAAVAPQVRLAYVDAASA